MGDDDMNNYIDPRKPSPRNYPKEPERVFRLRQGKDITVPAGTLFTRAPLERGGGDRLEAIVVLGSGMSVSEASVRAYLCLPTRVAAFDLTEWFEEVTGDEQKTDNP